MRSNSRILLTHPSMETLREGVVVEAGEQDTQTTEYIYNLDHHNMVDYKVFKISKLYNKLSSITYTLVFQWKLLQ